MNLKELYKNFLPVVDRVVDKINNSHHFPQSLKDDIISTAQLSAFEFCNLYAKDRQFDDPNLEDECFAYVDKEVRSFYRAEMKQYHTVSTNAPLRGKDETFGQLEDTIKSKNPSAYEVLERKNSYGAIKDVFASLSTDERLIFYSVLKDVHLQEHEIAKMHGINEKQVKQTVDGVLKKIFDEAGESAYDKYSGAITAANQKRFLAIIQENWKYLSPKTKNILKSRYVLNMSASNVAKKFGYCRADIVRRATDKLKVLAGGGEGGEEAKIKLVEKLKKEREQEKFIEFVRHYKPCKTFFETLSKKRRVIFIRHYIKGETYVEISKTYRCKPASIEEICHKVLKTLRKYVYGDENKRLDILTSLKRTKNFHTMQRLGRGMEKPVRDFLKLDDYKKIINAFPSDDQIIIKDYLIDGKTAAEVSKKVSIEESGVQRRGKLLIEKIKVFTEGTESEKTRALQMLDKNHWTKHKIDSSVVEFMKHKNYNQIVKELPTVDQIILQRYLINGELAPIVAKEINLGRSGLSYRAAKLLDAINIFNTGSQEEIASRLETIKRTTITKAKIKER